ncbi:MAG TPA: hypothetical protein VGP04_23075, partial [Pseudonocardiaceae bacterium]|nr:hypothetical protein [Pseudonocardiaceae bacterium]
DTTDHLGLTDIQRRHPDNDLPSLRIFLQHDTLPLVLTPNNRRLPAGAARGQANLIRVLEAH